MVQLERPPASTDVRLTELTDCGGCAAKLGADLLAEALAGFGAAGADATNGNLIAGLDPPDDGAVYRIADDLAIIGTLDFFPPLVDDPRTFGEIAATNAVSDIFAMGGRVLFALSIAAFPEELPPEIMGRIFEGASSKVREAGGTLAGGHTIRDPEPKYGLAVIGAAHPDRLLRKAGALPGDRLLLTKALGTGLIVSGRRRGLTSDDDVATAIDSMRRLNRSASEVLATHGVKAATDVTGFGLLGHAAEMARASAAGGEEVGFVIDAASLPALPGALDVARAGVETGGAAHNRRAVADLLSIDPGVAPEIVALAYDPQTSGGLLAAIPEPIVDAVGRDMDAGAVEHSWIGRVEVGAGIVLAGIVFH
jgi:selenide,water dikinase